MVNNNVNSIAKKCLVPIFAIALVACGGADTTTNTAVVEIDTTKPVDDWQLVWSDEFDGTSLNSSNWTIEVNCDGGGNFEQQCYTDAPDNISVDGGMLTITALPAAGGADLPYTSGRINTSGKADFKYGRIEMSAKMPAGQGTWPAFWMLPTDYVYGGWPKSGEIDIMEAVNLGVVGDDGVAETRVFGTLHYGQNAPNNDFSGKDFRPPSGLNPSEGFNTYAIEWQEGEIRWYFNGYLYAMQRKSDVRYSSSGQAIGLKHRGWYTPRFSPLSGEPEVTYGAEPFDEYFHMVLNLAVGGSFPENTNAGGIDPTAFENGQTLEVDYVRVYQCNQNTQTGAGCETLRAGYDDPEDAFVEGKAPSPTLPVPETPVPITIFADAVNPGWPMWDNTENSVPEVVMDEDPTYGSVAEFKIETDEGTVLGFNSRLAETPMPYNAGAMVGVGSLKFDMKVVSQPTSGANWYLKIEADNNSGPAAEFFLTESVEGVFPPTGEWQSYTFPISALADKGLDVSNIDLIMIFPAWTQGNGAVFRIDNMRIEVDGSGGSSPEFVLFDGTINPDYDLWDCCGGTSPTIEMEDAPYGEVAEFRINDNNGTVLGFDGRNAENYIDASALLANGVFQFDMKVVNLPTAADTPWLLKIETSVSTVFVEMPLTGSNEGLAPAEGVWQTYTFDLIDLSDAGLDVSEIAVVMIFPTWTTGEGAVYRIDNMKFYDPNASGAPAGPLLEIFADAFNPLWNPWDCCANSTPTVEMDDAEHGATTQFSIADNNGTVLGYTSRVEGGQPFDASSIVTTGVVQFEMKIVSPATALTWMFKVESNNTPTEFAELNLNMSQEGAEPVIGEWQTYTFDLLTLSDAGLDVSGIDVVMIFPAWGTGAGAVYRVDNFYIGNPSDISGEMSGGDSGNNDAAHTVFADQVSENWPLWDCCAGSSPTVEMVEAPYGAVAQFSIGDAAETVLGFNSREATNGTPYDASAIEVSGKFSFDMKLVTAPSGGETPWLLKIESNASPTQFVELPLTASAEGAAPVEGQWQTYTFDMTQLTDSSLDPTAIDVIMVFPAWNTGAGSVYQIDNVVFTAN